MKHWSKILILVFTVTLFFNSCKINYTFTGASICPEAKTVSVKYFENKAELVQPVLAQTLTDALKDRLTSQTSLDLVSSGGDLQFEGEITGYNTRPEAIQGNETAALNRLTITIKVKYSTICGEDKGFETTFSRFDQYESSLSLSQVETSLIETITEALVDDIFNKAVVNW